MSLLDRLFGDRKMAALLDRYSDSVRAQLRRLAPQLRAADIDDLTQEVRIRLWQTLKAERKVAQPASYLKKVVLSATIDALRRAKVRGEQEIHQSWDDVLLDSVPADGSDLGEQTAQRQAVEALERQLKSGDPDAARALRLHAMGYTTEEIGKALAWTEAKARNIVYRALKSLRSPEEPP